MSLIERLPQYANRNAQTALALQVEHDDGVRARVDYEALILETNGVETRITLDGKTIATVAAEAQAAGYQVPFVSHGHEAAILLVLGAEDLRLGTSLLWRFLNASDREFARAADQAQQAVQNVYLHHAAGEYLDEHGAYYGFPRTTAEADGDYRDRIISEILRPKANNRALAMILAQWFGTESRYIDVIDLPLATYDVQAYLHDGKWDYMDRVPRDGSTSTGHTGHFCQFRVRLGVADDRAVPAGALSEVVNRYKAAGTYLREIQIDLGLRGERESDAEANPHLHVGLALRSQISVRDGGQQRAVAERYLYDAEHVRADHIPRDGVTRYSGIRFGPSKLHWFPGVHLTLGLQRASWLPRDGAIRFNARYSRDHAGALETDPVMQPLNLYSAREASAPLFGFLIDPDPDAWAEGRSLDGPLSGEAVRMHPRDGSFERDSTRPFGPDRMSYYVQQGHTIYQTLWDYDQTQWDGDATDWDTA